MTGYKPQKALDEDALAASLSRHYGIELRSLEFVPAGECSAGYAAATDRGRLFLKFHQRAPGGAPWDEATLERKLAAVAAMQPVPGIVAPHPTLEGRYTVPSPQGPMAVFPYVDARWTDPDSASDDETRRAARLLAGIHSCRDKIAYALLQPYGDSLDVPFAGPLRDLMRSVEVPTVDVHDAPIRAILHRHREDVLHALDELEILATQIRASGVRLVITHGDPHHANLLRAPDGSLSLIDWDDVALGPIERDLVFFQGRRFNTFWCAYTAIRDASPVDADLITFYRRLWDLQEIADYGTRLRRGGMSDHETQRCWDEFAQYLPLREDRFRHDIHAS